MLRCKYYSLLLAGSNAGCCTTVVSVLAVADFDKDESVFVFHDEVDFASPTMMISGDFFKAGSSQITECQVFSFVSPTLGA